MFISVVICLYMKVLLNYFLQNLPWEEKVCQAPLLAINKIIIYKNCVSIPRGVDKVYFAGGVPTTIR